MHYIGDSHYLVLFSICTIPGIALIETVLTGDPLYNTYLWCSSKCLLWVKEKQYYKLPGVVGFHTMMTHMVPAWSYSVLFTFFLNLNCKKIVSDVTFLPKYDCNSIFKKVAYKKKLNATWTYLNPIVHKCCSGIST